MTISRPACPSSPRSSQQGTLSAGSCIIQASSSACGDHLRRPGRTTASTRHDNAVWKISFLLEKKASSPPPRRFIKCCDTHEMFMQISPHLSNYAQGVDDRSLNSAGLWNQSQHNDDSRDLVRAGPFKSATLMVTRWTFWMLGPRETVRHTTRQ